MVDCLLITYKRLTFPSGLGANLSFWESEFYEVNKKM